MKQAKSYSDLPNMPSTSNLARYLPLNNVNAYSTYDLTHTINFDITSLPVAIQNYYRVTSKNKTMFHISSILYDTPSFAWVLAKLNNKKNLLDVIPQGSYVLYLNKDYLIETFSLF
jgi:hypothetical protein